MNLRIPQGPRNSPKRWHAIRGFTAFTLIVLLFFTAGTVQAGPVRINQVVQTLSSYQGPADLSLGATQDPVSGQTKTSTGGPRTDSQVVNPVSGETAKLDELLAGFPLVQDPQKLGVEVVEEAEVEGTICDCGEIYIPGGFPKWPLLFLAAVPLVFINDCDNCDETPDSTPTPTPPSPTPTPTPQVPEPASLLLFGTGLMALGAGLRRRRRNRKS